MWNRKDYDHNIMIIGGFKKARSLANSLIRKGYEVTAVNKSQIDCEKLAEIDKLKVIYGDGTKKFVLEDAKAHDCSIVICLTNSDEDNLVICEMCKKYFGVKKTVCLLSDPEKTDLFYKMGVDRVVCTLNTITNIIEEQAIMEKMLNTIPVDDGRINIVEVPIYKNSVANGKKLWELNLSKEIVVGCIIRDGKSLIPRGDPCVYEGDVLLIITSAINEIEDIREFFGNDKI